MFIFSHYAASWLNEVLTSLILYVEPFMLNYRTPLEFLWNEYFKSHRLQKDSSLL